MNGKYGESPPGQVERYSQCMCEGFPLSWCGVAVLSLAIGGAPRPPVPLTRPPVCPSVVYPLYPRVCTPYIPSILSTLRPLTTWEVRALTCCRLRKYLPLIAHKAHNLRGIHARDGLPLLSPLSTSPLQARTKIRRLGGQRKINRKNGNWIRERVTRRVRFEGCQSAEGERRARCMYRRQLTTIWIVLTARRLFIVITLLL